VYISFYSGNGHAQTKYTHAHHWITATKPRTDRIQQTEVPTLDQTPPRHHRHLHSSLPPIWTSKQDSELSCGFQLSGTRKCGSVDRGSVALLKRRTGTAQSVGAGRQRGRSSSPGRAKNFLFSMSSRPALGPTQSPIQWLPGALSPGVKRQGLEAGYLLPASAEVKKT
jgi:hypothetical protein